MGSAPYTRTISLSQAIDVRDTEPHSFHASYDRSRRRGAGRHRTHFVFHPLLELVRRIDQRVEYNRCTAEMRDLMGFDGRENSVIPHMPQTDTGACYCCKRPGETP